MDMYKIFDDSKRYLEDYLSDCLLVLFRSGTGCLIIFFTQMCFTFHKAPLQMVNHSWSLFYVHYFPPCTVIGGGISCFHSCHCMFYIDKIGLG